MKRIAIITARGGSKRIPRKSIKEFCGQPIIKYSIDVALASGIFDEVMVSTDDPEIASISKAYGAKVPFMRSEETSSDHASTADVIEEVLQSYKDMNIAFDYVCCIYPTAPFITPDKLKKAFQLLQQEEVESVIPVVQYSFPPQRCFVINNEKLEYKWSEYANMRSQDLEPIYHDCGQFYFIKTRAFMQERSMVTQNTAPLIMPETEVQDIDNEADWEIAEMKYRVMKLK